ncbi:MAG: DUF547 domain-containing protein [Terrimicrobiaceae bacterium]
MRCLIVGCLLLSLATASADAESPYESALGHHVRVGGVDYAAWKASPEDLQAVRDFTEAAAGKDLTGLGREERLAFLINAYNAWMLRQVLEKYPIQSVKEIAPNFGVFSEKRITVAGRKMSLNELEKEWLLKEFREPRVHFAINCASRSCPPLKASLWSAEDLEAQFDDATRAYLTRNPLGFDEKSGRVSSIFDWYAADFGGPDGVRAFLGKHRTPPPKIGFLEYDWSLNSVQ